MVLYCFNVLLNSCDPHVIAAGLVQLAADIEQTLRC